MLDPISQPQWETQFTSIYFMPTTHGDLRPLGR